MSSDQPAVLERSSKDIWLADKIATMSSASTFFTIYRNDFGKFITYIIT
ncbi:hypothetical protein SAMN02746095_03880 [Acidocella aminolytica 101 = DSM 11237]|nr:hypothetical protein SAMN02746095_03880 [Acidocella aminolytica 101 = DSM 11237]